MITADGWLDWCIRLPSLPGKTNPGVNPVKGIFMHSAEGYGGTLLDPNSEYGYNGNHRWHLTNLFDGRLYQHAPFTTRCWHASAANDSYVGCENEGDAPKDASLNEAQIDNAVRFIRDLAAWKGWTPTRPASPTDTSHTLWEHNEVVRLGGTSTACPSGRIPWDVILNRLQGKEGEDSMRILHGGGNTNGPAYLLVGGRALYIPSSIYADLVAIVYGQSPAAPSQETWDWLKANQVYVE